MVDAVVFVRVGISISISRNAFSLWNDGTWILGNRICRGRQLEDVHDVAWQATRQERQDSEAENTPWLMNSSLGQTDTHTNT